MHQRKSKKILIYFLLFIFIGSVNNINLNEIKLDSVENINISGLDRINYESIEKEIKNLNLENIFFLPKKQIQNILETNTLIETYNVNKKYPSTLDIKIKKTNFLAKINNEGKIYLIGSNGRLIEDYYINRNLPFVFGKPSVQEFLDLKKIIDQSKIPYNKIKNFYFFQSKRWDLEFNNNKIAKLPKFHEKKTLNNLFELLSDQRFSEKKIIDLRVKDQIITND